MNEKDKKIFYGMDSLESKAYDMYMIWVDLSRKKFPDYQHGRVSHGDPRKSLLFKICYKLVRETQGDILEEKDYRLYVRAQLDILKHIENNGGKPIIDPNCLVGDKAWKRWKLWKKKYDSISQNSVEVSQTGPGERKAIEAFEKTKEFIVKNLGACPSFEKYQEIYINKNLFKWINFGKISPYYVAISPYIAKIMQPEDFKRLNFDLILYKNCITDEVKNKFIEFFPYEFQKPSVPPVE